MSSQVESERIEADPTTTEGPVRRSIALAVAGGLVVFGLTYILRETGLLVGPAVLIVVIACYVLAPLPKRFSDRFIVTLAICLGWIPLVGWIPSLELRFDVPGLLLAIAAGSVCSYQLLVRRGTRRVVAIPTVSEVLALVLGALTSLWWYRPVRGFTASGIVGLLERSGYDNVSHFSMYRENLRLGSFIQVHPHLPGGAARVGYDYPQGIHQAFALITRLFARHPSLSVDWLLHSYVNLLLLTAGLTVTLGCLAVSRLVRHDPWIAIPAMAVVVALFAFGRFGPFTGTFNYEIAVMAVAVAVTLLVRPTLSPTWNFLAVAGLGLIVAYNWFPLLILMAPALIIATLRAVADTHGTTRRTAIVIGVALTVVAYLLPLVSFSHRGASWLNLAGANDAPPWGLWVVCIGALVVLAAVRQISDSDLWTNVVVAAPAVVGAAAVILVTAYEVHSTGVLMYYGEKLATAVLGVCVVVLAVVGAHQLSNSRFRKQLSAPWTALLAIILTVAALQIDGYVGPYQQTIQSSYNASGFLIRDGMFQQPRYSVDAEALIAAARSSAKRPGYWWYIEPNSPGGFKFLLPAQWFWALRGEPSSENGLRPHLPLQLDGSLTPAQMAQIIVADFPNPSKYHLFVPAWLKAAIIEQDNEWARPGRILISQSGSTPING